MAGILRCSIGVAMVTVALALAPSGLLAQDDDDDAVHPLMAAADFNRDGFTDIVEASLPDGNGAGILTVLLGQADGKFKEIASEAVLGRAPKAIVAGDFNHDGFEDAIVGDDDGSLKLFLGDGTGKLVPAGEVARVGSVVSIAVADFNHDGIPDIAVSDWLGSSVVVFLGAGNGRFDRLWSFPLRMPGVSARVATGDFNGDGIPDLAIVYGDDAGYTYKVMVGDGKGGFTDAPKLSFFKDPNAHCPT